MHDTRRRLFVTAAFLVPCMNGIVLILLHGYRISFFGMNPDFFLGIAEGLVVGVSLGLAIVMMKTCRCSVSHRSASE